MSKEKEIKISNEPLREAFLRSGMDAATIASFCGWMKNNNGVMMGDTSTLKRSLGLMPWYSGGKKVIRTEISLERATKIGDALNLDPVDYGA